MQVSSATVQVEIPPHFGPFADYHHTGSLPANVSSAPQGRRELIGPPIGNGRPAQEFFGSRRGPFKKDFGVLLFHEKAGLVMCIFGGAGIFVCGELGLFLGSVL